MTTVVIAAHNEAAVIGRCLDSLLRDAHPGELEVIVSANGCTDATARVARARAGVTVVESPLPGKTAALNRAEAVAGSWPRVYLDADIPATAHTIRVLRDALADGRHLVATPSRHLDVTGRPLAVRAYFAIQRHLPVFEEGLFGRGLIAVSEEGRSRFEVFPDVVADDLFLDSLFSRDERVRLAEVSTTVATPLRTRDLVNRLVRVRRGNSSLRAGTATPEGAVVRGSDPTAWLRLVVVRRPWLAPAALVYVAITAYAGLLARRRTTDPGWGRDESTREASADPLEKAAS
jgi:glycosyltransferase involved in cell wall biosynthesis